MLRWPAFSLTHRKHLFLATQIRTSIFIQLIPGCATYSDYLSCSYISNLCAFSLGSMSTPECQFFTSNSLTASLYPNTSAFALTFSKQASVSLKIVSYLPTGNYLG